MPFKKGQKKTGGKKKGTVNKATRDIKLAYQQLIENNLDNLTMWLEKIAKENPEKAIRIIADLSEYVIPKLARSETDINIEDKREKLQSLFPTEQEINEADKS